MCSIAMFIEMPSVVTLFRVQTPQIPCSKILKTIYKVLNNGFIYRLKLLKVHLTFGQTVLNAEKKVQNLFLTSEFKGYF